MGQDVKKLKKKIRQNELRVKSDRGNTTVVLRKEQYIRRTEKFN